MCVMSRHPGETVSVLTYRTGIQDANLAGNVHGGWIMKLCDDVAAIAAASSHSFMIQPPCTLPARLASCTPVR